MSKFQPLNPLLYNLLTQAFGRPQVHKAGMKMLNPVYTKDFESGRLRMTFDDGGEVYAVSCPYCTDQRHRLNINHCWGRRDPISGSENLHLIRCFNETDCMSDATNRYDLRDRLFSLPNGTQLSQATILEGQTVDLASHAAEWPGVSLPLHELPHGHVARRYLWSRNLDPDVLSRDHGFRYCQSSQFASVTGRIIIPVYMQGQLKGWQARYVGETDWKNPAAPMKYYWCPGVRKSWLLYRADELEQSQTVTITEGVLDALAVGSSGTAIFGESLSPHQHALLTELGKGRAGILLLDPEALDKPWVQRIQLSLVSLFSKGFTAVALPYRIDPGSYGYDSNQLRDIIAAKAAEQGVEVSWGRFQPEPQKPTQATSKRRRLQSKSAARTPTPSSSD